MVFMKLLSVLYIFIYISSKYFLSNEPSSYNYLITLVFSGNVQDQASSAAAAAAAGPVTPDWSGFQVLPLKHLLSIKIVEKNFSLIVFSFSSGIFSDATTWVYGVKSPSSSSLHVGSSGIFL